MPCTVPWPVFGSVGANVGTKDCCMHPQRSRDGRRAARAQWEDFLRSMAVLWKSGYYSAGYLGRCIQYTVVRPIIFTARKGFFCGILPGRMLLIPWKGR